jgi:hypothetical protein
MENNKVMISFLKFLDQFFRVSLKEGRRCGRPLISVPAMYLSGPQHFIL